MTHEVQSTALDHLLQILGAHGFDGMAEAIEILLSGLFLPLDPLTRAILSVPHCVWPQTIRCRTVDRCKLFIIDAAVPHVSKGALFKT